MTQQEIQQAAVDYAAGFQHTNTGDLITGFIHGAQWMMARSTDAQVRFQSTEELPEIKDIVQVLRNKRRELNLTLEDVGKALSINIAYLSRIENGGVKKPGMDILRKLGLYYHSLTKSNENSQTDNHPPET